MRALATHPFWRNLGLIFAAGATVAAVAITVSGVVTWSLTERFADPFGQAVAIGLVPLVFGLVGSALLFPLLLGLRRYGASQRWVAVMAGGLLFAAFPAVGLFSFRTSWLTFPLGLVAGFMLSRRDGKLIGWIAIVFFLLGLGVWATFVINDRADARREKLWELRRTRPSILGDRILGGTGFGSEVWLFNADGRTVSFDLSSFRPTLRVAHGVAAIQSDTSSVWLLIAPSRDWQSEHQPAGRFRLARFDGHHWQNSNWVNYDVDGRPVTLVFGASGPVVIGATRLYAFNGLKLTRQRALSRKIQTFGNFVATVVGKTIYLGANRGEWGGGLLRIDLPTGAVFPTERRDTRELCSGPLNADCDPVTGVVGDSSHPGCVFASIGISHMMWVGRVLHVCGNKVDVVLEAPLEPIGEKIERLFSSRARQLPIQTEPFFGMAKTPDGFWAVTPRALYRWSTRGVNRQRFPKLETRHGLSVSTAVPGLLVVSTDANAAYSLSGITPLIFAAGNQHS